MYFMYYLLHIKYKILNFILNNNVTNFTYQLGWIFMPVMSTSGKLFSTALYACIFTGSIKTIIMKSIFKSNI